MNDTYKKSIFYGSTTKVRMTECPEKKCVIHLTIILHFRAFRKEVKRFFFNYIPCKGRQGEQSLVGQYTMDMPL